MTDVIKAQVFRIYGERIIDGKWTPYTPTNFHNSWVQAQHALCELSERADFRNLKVQRKLEVHEEWFNVDEDGGDTGPFVICSSELGSLRLTGPFWSEREVETAWKTNHDITASFILKLDSPEA